MAPIADRRANGGRLMDWARILAYITGTVGQELLLRNEYLAAENRILRGQLKGRLRFSDAERLILINVARLSTQNSFATQSGPKRTHGAARH